MSKEQRKVSNNLGKNNTSNHEKFYCGCFKCANV